MQDSFENYAQSGQFGPDQGIQFFSGTGEASQSQGLPDAANLFSFGDPNMPNPT